MYSIAEHLNTNLEKVISWILEKKCVRILSFEIQIPLKKIKEEKGFSVKFTKRRYIRKIMKASEIFKELKE